MLSIHSEIKNRLTHFVEIKKIPNIIFYGPQGSGKKELVRFFLQQIYPDGGEKNKLVLYANCGNNTGIKFIREDLKFFAKTNINSSNGNLFKSIILSNADKLTIDAQSALRRCIELFSHSTRFFIIVEDKYKLLKPILSRFSEIYIPLPVVNGKPVNLHTYNINNNATSKIQNSIKRYLVNFENNTNNIIKISELMYNKGISGLDLIEYISYTFKDDEYKYKLLAVISKSKLELHNELITILFILNLMFFRSNEHLENILGM